MDGWTVIPRWLYENDLPDVELQEVYVREAEKKWQALRDSRRAIEEDLADALDAERRAVVFLADARAALERYRREAQEAAAPPKRVASPRRRTLPRPRADG